MSVAEAESLLINSTRIYLVSWIQGAKIGSRKVQGYPVTIEGWEEYEFFVWNRDGIEPGWCVTEVRSGGVITCFPRHLYTRMQVIDAAKAKLDRNGKEAFEFAIASYPSVYDIPVWKGDII